MKFNDILDILIQKNEGKPLATGLAALKETVELRLKAVILVLIGEMSACTYLSGKFCNLFLKENAGFFKTILNGLFTFPVGTLITLVSFLFLLYLDYRVLILNYENFVYDTDRKIKFAKNNTDGSAREMDDEEVSKSFIVDAVENFKPNIIGYSRAPGKEAQLYGIMNQYGINSNICAIGAPGCGKSRCIIVPMIMQCIRRGESCVISDPKGELYDYTYYMAKSHGYDVKRFDLCTDTMIHSDSVHMIKTVGKSVSKARSFAHTFIINMCDKMDFWQQIAEALLAFAVIYVNSEANRTFPPTFEGIHMLVQQQTANILNLKSSLPEKHPGQILLATFESFSERAQEDGRGGLALKLNAFVDKKLYKITGVEDMDYTKPGREKCLYFLGFSDSDRSNTMLSALFITQLYQELTSYADNKTTNKKLPVRVNMILDEFKAIGVIPDFESKIATVRSRGINTICAFQTMSQLEANYPDEYDSILNCFSCILLLQTNSLETAEFFANRSGDTTIVDFSNRYEKEKGKLIDIHATVQQSEASRNRTLFTKHEILTMDINDLFVVLSTKNVLRLKKYDFMKHPMAKEMREYHVTQHLGKWLAECTDEDIENYYLEQDLEGQVFEEDVPTEELYRCNEEDYRIKPEYTVDFDHPWDEIRSFNRYNRKGMAGAKPDFCDKKGKQVQEADISHGEYGVGSTEDSGISSLMNRMCIEDDTEYPDDEDV